MYKRISWFIIVLLLVTCGGDETPPPTSTPTSEPITIRFISGVFGGLHYEMDEALIDEFTAQTGINVEHIVGPESATERLAAYLNALEVGSDEIDVYQIDVIWPSIVGEYMLDLYPYLEQEAQEHFAAIIDNNTVDGKLVGMPYYTDAGVLYYRTDLLAKYGYTAPPATWDELEEMATTIQAGERDEGNLGFWGYVWQGAPYEGLTCNALEWQVSAGGGRIIEPDGTITVNNPQAIAALERAAGWMGTISPPGVTGYQEEDARAQWQSGLVAFMRNWPYAYLLGQATDSVIKDKFAIAPLPSGGARHADTLGGWQLAVSKYSRHPEAAVAFVEYMTGAQVQLQRSVLYSFSPTRPALYDDPEALAANPYYKDLKDVFVGGAVARPSTVTGDRYAEVSQAYFTAVHAILTGKTDVATVLANLEAELVALTGFPTGKP